MAERTRLKLYAVTHDILGDVFWDVFRRGLLDAAARYDVDVEHLRPGRFSPEIQAGMIDAAVAARPDGIIATVPDVGAVDGPLRRAVACGIPVICVNAEDPRAASERIPYLFYIGGDDGNAGELAGRYLIEKSGGQPAVCVDHYMFDHICHNDRWFGFKRAYDAAGVPAERLRVDGSDMPAATEAVAAYFDAHPETVGALTLGPPGAEMVLAAEARLPREKALKHLTFDVAALQLDGIRSGRILATIDSQQYLQGYLAVEWMWLHVTKGFTPASDIHTGPAIVDLSNLEEAASGVWAGFR
jgi:simple sugar transport system substrate-binding protein